VDGGTSKEAIQSKAIHRPPLPTRPPPRGSRASHRSTRADMHVRHMHVAEVHKQQRTNRRVDGRQPTKEKPTAVPSPSPCLPGCTQVRHPVGTAALIHSIGSDLSTHRLQCKPSRAYCHPASHPPAVCLSSRKRSGRSLVPFHSLSRRLRTHAHHSHASLSQHVVHVYVCVCWRRGRVGIYSTHMLQHTHRQTDSPHPHPQPASHRERERESIVIIQKTPTQGQGERVSMYGIQT